MGSKHANETKQTKPGTDRELETRHEVGAIASIDELKALLLGIRMQSPWITQREAEHYLRCRSGTLSEAIRIGELPTYQRTPTSTVLINVHELNAWVSRTWIVRSGGDAGVSRA